MKYEITCNNLQGNGTALIGWHKNPPGASYMGGVWDCQRENMASH